MLRRRGDSEGADEAWDGADAMGSWSLLESKANNVLSVPGVLSVAFDGAKGMAFGVDVETAEEGIITLLLEVLGKRFVSVVGS